MHRRIALLLLILPFIVCSAYSQPWQHSDLYLRVDSIMRYQLKFNVDSAEQINVKLRSSNQPTSTKPLVIRDYPTIWPEHPLIIIDNKTAKRNELNQYRIASIKSIQVMPKGPAASALYGSSGIYGVIYITTKHYKH